MTRNAGSKGHLCAFALALVAVAGCSEPPPLVIAEQHVAVDGVLAARLQPTADAWQADGERLTSPGWRSARMGDGFELGARLPATADGPLEAGIGRSERHLVRLHPEGASPARVSVDGGRAVYREAYRATDSIVVTTPERVEVFFLLRSAAAPREFRWRVELPEALPRVRAEPSGALLFTEEHGAARLRIPRPFAIDARGERRQAELAFTDGQLVVRLDTGALTFPILLDPEIETVVWEQRSTTGPSARYGHALAYDSARGETVLFGGYDGTLKTDTWTWNGSTWTLKCSSCVPGGRYGHGMAFDASRGVVVMFGGQTSSNNYLGDVWEWNGSTWAAGAGGGPSKRANFGLTYDSDRHLVVFYGGEDKMSYYRDTWEYNGSTWTMGTIQASDPFRYRHVLAYDSAIHRTVLHGGISNVGYMSDTWEWNGTAWASVAAGATARGFHGLAFSTPRSRMVMFGGATGTSYYNDTWERDATTWTQRATTGPSVRAQMSMAYDSARGRIVIFGGFDGTNRLGDTWEYHARGGPCSAAAQCDTGNCVDGVCCETTCTGVCMACNLANHGLCEPVLGATDPPGCTGTHSCNNAGQCLLVDGQPCTGGSQCISTFCVDGFCCGTACGNACDECATTPGTCKVATQGSAGDPSCSPYVCNGTSSTCPATCNSDLDCDTPTYLCNTALHQCVEGQPLGGPCGAARECSSGFCSDSVCCDAACTGACDACNSSGHCEYVTGPGNPSCGSYQCTGTGPNCPGGCSSDAECATGFYCAAGGTCQPQKTQGQSCNLTTDCQQAGCRECATGACSDGFCCNDACGGSCDECASTPGTCKIVGAGGSGNPSCGGFLCNGVSPSCPTLCTVDGQCAPGYYCNGSTCLPKIGAGQPCGSGHECVSGFCSDNVCCNVACTGACDACNVNPGTCVYSTGGGSPSCGAYLCSGTGPDCPSSCTSDANCAANYYCNAAGQCVARKNNGQGCNLTTDCRVAGCRECVSGNCVDGYCCNAPCAGGCDVCNATPGSCTLISGGQPGVPPCPGGVLCNGTSGNCPGGCTSDTDCPSDKYCDAGGQCVSQLGNGSVCGRARQCTSSRCVDGYCCNAACTGACDACNANPGTCTNVTGGGSPSCGAYVCSGTAPTCPTSCTSDAQCAANYYCAAATSTCVARKAQGDTCNPAADCKQSPCRECQSGYCADGRCCNAACDGGCDTCNASGVCTLLGQGSGGADPACSPYVCNGAAGGCPTTCADDSGCAAGYFCNAGACVAAASDGSFCGRNRQCQSGFCVHNVCCHTACDQACQTCVASPGNCTLIGAGYDGSPTCSPYVCDGSNSSCPNSCTADAGCAVGHYCDGTACQAKKSNGNPCSRAAECTSSKCVDGYCCNADCTASCDRCNLASSLGTCTVVAQGDPGANPPCAPYVCSGGGAACPATCAADTDCVSGYYCDGTNHCVQKKANGQQCSGANQCASTHCVDGYCCDSSCPNPCDACNVVLGQCSNVTAGTAGSPACGDYLCSGTSPGCPTTCTDDAGCVAGRFCDNGSCAAPRANGQACDRSRQCSSGYCVDGFCCATPCTGQCDVCNATPGTCTPAGAGSAGTPSCTPFVCDGTGTVCPTTCTTDVNCAPDFYCAQSGCTPKKLIGSSCSGNNQCRSGYCVDSYCCDTPCSGQCDACDNPAGTCTNVAAGSAGNPSCTPYLCSGQGPLCPNTCTTDANCITGYHCILNSCTDKLPNGSSCTAGEQCASSNCRDGVCCDTECQGACFYCAYPASKGTCTQVTTGEDPRNLCPGTAGSDCKATCSAAGLCAYPDAARRCGEWTCSGTSLHTYTCDGNGNCTDRGTVDCAPYACNSAGCPTLCTDNTSCASPNTCEGGTCGGHRALGAACTVATDCESGLCVDGVCCATECTGKCQRCDLPPAAGGQADGICRAPVGEDPDGDCPGEGLCTGTCAGDGTCSYPGPEAACDTCKACNRAGTCDQLPASGDDPDCLTISCGGLSSECRLYTDLTAARCSAPGLCKRSNDPLACLEYTDVEAGTPCSGGVCSGGVCVPQVADAGTGDGGGGEPPKSGCGCRSAGPGAGASALALLGLLGLVGRRRRREKR